MRWPNTCEFHNSVPALLCPFLGWVAYFLRDISVYLKCAPPTILDVYKGYVLLKISWLIDPISTQSITFGERETVFRLISARKEETCTRPQFVIEQANLLRAATGDPLSFIIRSPEDTQPVVLFRAYFPESA